MSGIDVNELHPLKIWLILFVEERFHLEIFGISVNFLQNANKPLRLDTFEIFHFPICGIWIYEEQPAKI